MRILHIYGAFPNKWQPYEVTFLKNLNAAGIQNLVYTLAPVNSDLPSPVPVYTSSREGPYLNRRLEQIFSLLGGLIKYRNHFKELLHTCGYSRAITEFSSIYSILKLNPHVVHIHHTHLLKQTVLSALEMESIPWIASFRGHDVMVRPLMNKEWRAGLHWIFSHASAVTVLSKSLEERIIQLGAPPEKIHVIPLGIEVDQPITISVQKSTPPYSLVCIGRLAWEKGHIYAVDAISQLNRRGLEVELIILGEGPLEDSVRFRAWQLGIPDKIHVLGYVDSTRMDQILSKCFAVVHPSLSEALSSALIRVQANGIPVIASNVGGIPEVVKNGETGILVDAARPDLLAEAIACLIKNPELWRKFHQNSLSRTPKVFGSGNEAIAYKNLYKDVLAKS